LSACCKSHPGAWPYEPLDSLLYIGPPTIHTSLPASYQYPRNAPPANYPHLPSHRATPPTICYLLSDRPTPPTIVTFSRTAPRRQLFAYLCPTTIHISRPREASRPPSITFPRTAPRRQPSVIFSRTVPCRPPSVTFSRTAPRRPPSVTFPRTAPCRQPSAPPLHCCAAVAAQSALASKLLRLRPGLELADRLPEQRDSMLQPGFARSCFAADRYDGARPPASLNAAAGKADSFQAGRFRQRRKP